MEQPDSDSLPAGPEPPALVQSVQLMGDDMFETPEVEDLAILRSASHSRRRSSTQGVHSPTTQTKG